MLSSVDKLKLGLLSLVGLMVLVSAVLAQIGLAALTAMNQTNIQGLTAALRTEIRKGMEQQSTIDAQQHTIETLKEGVAEAKKDAKAKPSKIVVVVPTAPPVTPTPEPLLRPTIEPKRGKRLW